MNVVGRTKEHGAHVVFLEVEHDALDAVLKLYHLARLHIGQSVNERSTVRHLQYGANLVEGDLRLDALQLTLDYFGYFARFDRSHSC